MVTAKENISYPLFSVNSWWAIRKKFIQSMPPRVTDTYLSTLLSMEIKSARNLVSPLKRMGLIDNDGKPTERAVRWRDGEQYASVCEEIRRDIYPPELLDIFSGPDSPRSSIENWFASRAGVGTAAKKGMTTFYLLLAEADYTKQDNTASAKAPKVTKKISPTLKSNISNMKTEKEDEATTYNDVSANGRGATEAPQRSANRIEPSLHIDIQIHIAPDASSEQIEQIFASMAKHLYRSKDIDEQ
jgi:Family of unknown function (DUF5343)